MLMVIAWNSRRNHIFLFEPLSLCYTVVDLRAPNKIPQIRDEARVVSLRDEVRAKTSAMKLAYTLCG